MFSCSQTDPNAKYPYYEETKNCYYPRWEGTFLIGDTSFTGYRMEHTSAAFYTIIYITKEGYRINNYDAGMFIRTKNLPDYHKAEELTEFQLNNLIK